MNDQDLNKDTIYDEVSDSSAVDWIDASGSGRDENTDSGKDSSADTGIAATDDRGTEDTGTADRGAEDTGAADTGSEDVIDAVDTGSEDVVDAVENADGEKEPDKKRKAKTGRRKKDRSGNAGPVRRNWFVKFLLCCLSFFLVFGIINLVYYLLGMEPFGTKTVSIDDAKIQYIDFFTYYVDVLKGTRSLNYDFSNMLGGSSAGLFSYYLASPFNLLLYFFGKEGVYRFFNVAAALKLATAGATFSWFLQRRFENRIRPVFVVALSMGYGLMQYQVAQSSNIMWLDGVYMLPLILLGVYEVIHRKTVWRLVLTVALCIFCNWYIAGINCLFSGIWFLFEFFFQDELIPKQKMPVNAVPDRRYSGRRRYATRPQLGITAFVVSACRYFWGMGLGVAMSAILFLPAISAMRQGKGQYKNIEFLTGFAGDLLSAVRGYVIGNAGDTSGPGHAALFCGGLALIGASALIFSASCRIRQKIAYLVLLGICFLMLYWEPATLVFSLLKRADSYWYRYSYLVCFVRGLSEPGRERPLVKGFCYSALALIYRGNAQTQRYSFCRLQAAGIRARTGQQNGLCDGGSLHFTCRADGDPALAETREESRRLRYSGDRKPCGRPSAAGCHGDGARGKCPPVLAGPHGRFADALSGVFEGAAGAACSAAGCGRRILSDRPGQDTLALYGSG